MFFFALIPVGISFGIGASIMSFFTSDTEKYILPPPPPPSKIIWMYMIGVGVLSLGVFGFCISLPLLTWNENKPVKKKCINFRLSAALLELCRSKKANNILALINSNLDIIDPNYFDGYGTTSLMHACSDKSMSYVALRLLQIKANPNLLNGDDHTALVIACMNSAAKSVDYLLEAQADVNLAPEGFLPLVKACENGMNSTVLKLIKAGSDYAPCNSSEITVEKALSFNYPQHPQRFTFEFSNVHLLNSSNYARVKTLFLVRQRYAPLRAMPPELMHCILVYLFA